MTAVDLEASLGELRSERGAIEATLTKEGLGAKVAEYLVTARAHAAGSSRLVLGGQPTGEHLAKVLEEDRLDDDEKLAGRLVARLERQGFGELSDRQKAAKLKALDGEIAAVTTELLAARKQAALEQVEREFSAA